MIEDLEIRKPLILPEPGSGVVLELSYDPAERSFAIQSRFEQSSAWSLHVVGFLRGERTESAFAATPWAAPAPGALEARPVEEFYQSMSDLGLRYGEEFRAVRELSAKGGQAAGRVALSAAAEPRAGEYPLHPVLLDGALHIFSAGAATVEDRRARMKLPVRFGRILFLRSPGASALVRAAVQQFNEEFLEGGLEIFDAEGRPCVLVDGFRAVSVAGVRRAGGSGGRDVAYHVSWERQPAGGATSPAPAAPLAHLREAARAALEEVVETRGRAFLEEAIHAGDDLAAAQIARGLSAMGVGDEPFSAASLGVAAPMVPAFGRLLRGLEKRGLVAKAGADFHATAAFAGAAENAPGILREFIEAHPAQLPEALLCAGNGAELGPILRGEKDAVQVLFSGAGAELLDQFYGDGLLTSHWLGGIGAAVREAARQLPEGRGLRILEVGAGTGGLTSYVLPMLERGLHRYTFSDVSAGFFPPAMQKLAAFPEIEYKVFDLEKPFAAQGFEAGAFDFIIGTNVLHAVADVRQGLANLFALLAPGGTLVFMDVATPQLWTETVFGLTSGWWRFTDRDLRTEHPLLSLAQWESVLHGAGFSETGMLHGLAGPEGEGQIGLLARKPLAETADRAGSAPGADGAEGAEGEPVEKSWLIFADDSALGEALVARLRGLGRRCRVVRRGKGFAQNGPDAFLLRPAEPGDWQELLQSCHEDAPAERFVYCWSLDASPMAPGDEAELMGTGALLHFAQALGEASPTAKVRIDLVTRGAQPVGRERVPAAVGQAPSIGLLRVIHNEHPNFICRAIDLAPTPSAADDEGLWRELLAADAEREIALRGEARYVQRLGRGREIVDQPLERDVPLRLESRERGHLDTLRFAPFTLPACGPGEVLIEVKAAGMNFRDVLKALALYPGEAPDARIFGDEVAGIVRATGAEVKHVAVGDRVFGLAVFGLATHSLARGGDVRPMPAGLSFEEAVTLPVVFMTSWHALYQVARIRPGEWVLVHAGAGGVGMAAIQIAHHLGAKVIASAGSPAKRALLETLGAAHVIDSRRGDFAETVLALTKRRGVDVVLNALAGEAIPMGLSCLAEFGRFIEIGKRDIYQNSRIPLWPLRRNASFHVVAMDAVFSGDEALTRELLETLAKLVEQGQLRPLPFRAFPASRVDAAFRLMAGGKHIGKVVVVFAESFVPRRGEPLAAGFTVRGDGAYLITGAFGGFGKVLANWLVACGARRLVLTGRSGAATAEAQAFVQSLQLRDVEVTVARADVGSAADVARLLADLRKAGQPLRGVFHLAMVIDDAPLSALTQERMRTVLAPKARGAWLLHEGTRDQPLECFVMFSSVSSIFGNPAQGNYGAANAFLDSLAHHRQALGLPALAVNWGVLGGEGYVARNERVAEFLARQGTASLSPGEVVSLLESFLGAGAAQAIAIRVDWAKWRQFFRGMQENPLLERIFAAGVETQEAGGKTSDWRNRIEAAAPAEKEGIIGQALREVIGSVLRVKPETLRDEQPLTDLGLDSLMGVEIETSIERSIGVSLPPASLLRARTIGQIVKVIAEHLGARTGSAAPARPVAPAPAPAVEEVDLDALSDADLDALLGGEAAEADEPQPTAQ